MLITLTIDGQQLQVAENTMILAAAKANGIYIPSLCNHESLEAWGGCRLCLVEITKPQWDGRTKLVTACLYPVEPELIVNTKSDTVLRVRKTIIDLLLARCPDSPEIQALAREMGVYQTAYKPDVARDNCIMCGLCARICEAIGVSAIATINRGYEKEVTTPYSEPSETCIGCLACAHICPTHNIPFEESAGTRTIWNRTFTLVPCRECGRTTITEEQLAYELKRSGLPEEYFTLCEVCKQKQTAKMFRELAGWQKELEAES